MANIIYKIEDASVWRAAQSQGLYEGSALDKADGFIHLSAADQVRQTALTWFAGRKGLILAHIDADALGDTLKWEASRGGALFPHNFGPLPMRVVLNVETLELDGEGNPIFGPDIP
jgi:uncharacterized protein (DUF952 family)